MAFFINGDADQVHCHLLLVFFPEKKNGGSKEKDDDGDSDYLLYLRGFNQNNSYSIWLSYLYLKTCLHFKF